MSIFILKLMKFLQNSILNSCQLLKDFILRSDISPKCLMLTHWLSIITEVLDSKTSKIKI